MAEILRQGITYHLRNSQISYIIGILPKQIVSHLYFGPRVAALDPEALLRHWNVAPDQRFTLQNCTLDRLPQEYPSFGLGDQREGSVAADGPLGNGTVDLRFVSAAVEDGKPALPGLPATFGSNAKTLRLLLRDGLTGLEAELRYTVFDDCAGIIRHVELRNAGTQPLTLTRAMSLCLELPDDGWDLITLSGAWARERDLYRRALVPGEQGVSSRMGATSQQQCPFLALARPHATEDQGDVLAAALVYSGNFSATVTVHQHHTARVMLGINEREFAWRLLPGESFQTPEAALVFSREGLGGMSRAFHQLWNRHLLPQRWVNARRPVLLNSWEAAYFDFDEEKLLSIAACAAQAGVELFVMDDGWFGHRDSDASSLGDWTANPRKLPGGLKGLGEKIRALGLQFGLWMEPEMVSPDSDLYRAHPDWALHIPGREPVTSRNQLILDMGREDVQAFVWASVRRALEESGAAYLKWDMNRNFSNVGSALLPPERQKEVPHRYMLGVYAVLDRLTREFPEVLVEGCAGGGGRFDPGMLYYSPQFWCSDNTDAISRCRIQYATSLLFPLSAMGSHVSAVPNHQTGRVTPMETRFAVAVNGCFGYELDPRALSPEERRELRRQIALAHETEELRQTGALYRLLSPFEGNDTAWITVSPDRREALFLLVRDRAQANAFPPLVRLRGLDPARTYRVVQTGETFGGDELMNVGLCCPLALGDAASLLYQLRAVEPDGAAPATI